MVAAVRAAAGAKLKRLAPRAEPLQVTAKNTADVILAPAAGRAMMQTTERVVAIGTSTGGTQALEEVLTALAARLSPGMVIVQHMPEKFTAAFAARLDSLCADRGAGSAERRPRAPGPRPDRPRRQAHDAQAQRRTIFRRSGRRSAGQPPPPLGGRAVPLGARKSAGANALGVIMTGMGDDGAAGLLEMRQAGAHTLAQDEETCVVFGMPKEAIKRGAVERVVPLGDAFRT